MIAIGVLKVLREEGIQVPRDCSVVGFDDIPIAAYTYPSLTTLKQPKYQLGYEAAQMMYKVLQLKSETSSTQGMTLKLNGELVIRESTAPPSNK